MKKKRSVEKYQKVCFKKNNKEVCFWKEVVRHSSPRSIHKYTGDTQHTHRQNSHKKGYFVLVLFMNKKKRTSDRR